MAVPDMQLDAAVTTFELTGGTLCNADLST